MKKSMLLLGFATVLLTSQVFSGCSKEGITQSPPVDTSNTIRINASGYSIAKLEVVFGGTVTWINDDNVSHTVTADDGSFNSGEIPPGGKFQIGFSKTGTFPYHCEEHASMKASIVVVGRR